MSEDSDLTFAIDGLVLFEMRSLSHICSDRMKFLKYGSDRVESFEFLQGRKFLNLKKRPAKHHEHSPNIQMSDFVE